MGIIPEKEHSRKAHCGRLFSYPGPLFFFYSCFAANVDDRNSVVHCVVAHPSYQKVQRSNNGRWLQHTPCCLHSPEPFLFSPFFLRFSPSELTSALYPAIQRMKLRIGC